MFDFKYFAKGKICEIMQKPDNFQDWSKQNFTIETAPNAQLIEMLIICIILNIFLYPVEYNYQSGTKPNLVAKILVTNFGKLWA